MLNYFNGKTVIITGSSGFIGSNLSNRLLSLGANVIGVDSFLTGLERNLPKHENFQFIKADVTKSPISYLPKNLQFDAILHFASPASPPWYQKYPIETYLVNTIATHNLLSYIKETNPNARLVFASTSEVYGDPLVHPQVESYWGNVNPNGKRSCYDEAKRLGETICGVFARDFDLDARIVRIFNTYGPNMDPADGRVIPNLVTQLLRGEQVTIYGDGNQTRSYCFVDDLVEFILRMAGMDGLKGETINIGNPEEFTVLETAKILHSIIRPNENFEPKFLPLPSDDPTKRRPDVSKAKQLLGYEAKTKFSDGLIPTIEYFKKVI